VVSEPPFDLTDPDLFADGPPHDVYAHLRDEAPLYWHAPTANTPDDEGFWCLTRHDDVAWAARQPILFSSVGGGSRDGGGTLIEDLPAGFAAGVLFNMQDDPRHRHLRRLVTPSVSPRRLRRIEAELADRCAALLDGALDRGRCDFLIDVAAELPLQAIASLLGVPQEDRHFLLDWADATLDFDDHNPGETSRRSQEAGAAMSAYCTRLLEEKRSCPTDDILSIIATAELPDTAEPGGPLRDLEQQMFFHLLVAAGSETTRNSITAGLLALMDRPGEWAALRADRSQLPGAVEEMLRWASSTVYNRRTATGDVERHGQVIRRAGLHRSHHVRHRSGHQSAPGLRGREPLLPRCQSGPTRDHPGVRRPARPGGGDRAGRPGRADAVEQARGLPSRPRTPAPGGELSAGLAAAGCGSPAGRSVPVRLAVRRCPARRGGHPAADDRRGVDLPREPG
jgi:cytochrome P450